MHNGEEHSDISCLDPCRHLGPFQSTSPGAGVVDEAYIGTMCGPKATFWVAVSFRRVLVYYDHIFNEQYAIEHYCFAALLPY